MTTQSTTTYVDEDGIERSRLDGREIRARIKYVSRWEGTAGRTCSDVPLYPSPLARGRAPHAGGTAMTRSAAIAIVSEEWARLRDEPPPLATCLDTGRLCLTDGAELEQLRTESEWDLRTQCRGWIVSLA